MKVESLQSQLELEQKEVKKLKEQKNILKDKLDGKKTKIHNLKKEKSSLENEYRFKYEKEKNRNQLLEMNIEQLKNLENPEFVNLLRKVQSKLQDIQINIQKSSSSVFKIENQIYIDQKVQELVHHNEQKLQKNSNLKR